MYRRLKGPAYTRRKYIGGVPNNRILRYFMGNRKAAEAGHVRPDPGEAVDQKESKKELNKKNYLIFMVI